MKQISTKQYFAESLKELCVMKSFDSISVRDIAENCEMSTRTFYNHFKDKQDLVLWIFTSKFDDCIKSNSAIDFVSLCRYLEDVMCGDKRLFISIMESEIFGERFFEEVIAYSRDKTIKYIVNHFKMDKVPEEIIFYVNFFYQGGFHLGYRFLKGEINLTKEKYLNYVMLSMPPSLRQYLLTDRTNNIVTAVEITGKKKCM